MYENSLNVLTSSLFMAGIKPLMRKKEEENVVVKVDQMDAFCPIDEGTFVIN